MSVFLSTPSARRATQGLEQYNRHNQNFYPRPLRGGRPSATAKYTASKNFYPRPLRGGRLLLVFEQAGLFVISIHALCEEGDRCPGRALLFLRKISIHALCEEGDAEVAASRSSREDFYPRPLRGGRPAAVQAGGPPGHFYPRPLRGGRQAGVVMGRPWSEFLSTPSARRATQEVTLMRTPKQFLSTPSARRATLHHPPGHSAGNDFYPRPLRGGRPPCGAASAGYLRISIHALCEEGDTKIKMAAAVAKIFLSTPSARRATPAPVQEPSELPISIHALCEEGDLSVIHIGDIQLQFLSTPSARRATTASARCCIGRKNFYPRPLRGGRPVKPLDNDRQLLFLSTPSARRATPH